MLLIEKVDAPLGLSVERVVYGKIIVAFAFFLALTVVFAYGVRLLSQGATTSYDSTILTSINSISSPFLDTTALFVTYTGNLAGIIVTSTVLAAVFYKRHAYRDMAQVICTIGGALLLNNLIKLILERDRPELWQLITHEMTYSFPSGHSLLSMSLAVLAIFFWYKVRYGWLIVVIATLYTLLVGLSRLYLGVHYPSDVVAGWLIGIVWAIIVALALGAVRVRKVT